MLSVHSFEALTALRERLEQGDIEGGRKMLVGLLDSYPDSEELRYFARMLARPKAVVREGDPTRSLEQERAWPRAHAREHPGCWLAVSGGTLVAADADYGSLLATVRQTVGAENVVLYFQP